MAGKGKHKAHIGKARVASQHVNTFMDHGQGQDPHAHPSHHAMNKHHGTPMGFTPHVEYGDGGEGPTEGIPGEPCNSEYD